ncbi:MAG TPA: hypothetical protein VMT74_01665 [Gaiellaceae bacterium]|nr:hypothetical protein [Gaiellaceae bacterium]
MVSTALTRVRPVRYRSREVSPSKETLAAGHVENCFCDASDLIEAYLVDGAAGMSGSAPIAIFHLICRSLADLRSAQFLASNGFTVQMYSLIRPAIEAINLVDLFAAEPNAADEWMAGEYWKFRPAAVRNRLGLGDDEVYSWACSHSHPRYPAMQLTTYHVTNETTGEETIRPYVGGLPLEFPQVLMATTLPGNVLCMLSQSLMHATVKVEVARTWPTVARRVGETLMPGFEDVYSTLEAHGLPEDECEKLLDSLKRAIAAAKELEELDAQNPPGG